MAALWHNDVLTVLVEIRQKNLKEYATSFVDGNGTAQQNTYTATLGEDNRLHVNGYIHELLEIFNDGYKAFNLTEINEVGDKSADYVNSWKEYILQAKYSPNAIYGKELAVTSGNGTQAYKGLTDGAPGIPNSYYYGWNIIPEEEISITLPAVNAAKLKMNFLSLPRHRIEIPSKIEIYSGDKLVSRHKPKTAHKDGPQLITWEEKLGNEANRKELILKIYSSGRYHIAKHQRMTHPMERYF